MAISVLALFVALGGSAYATHTHRMGTQDLQRHAVTTPKLAPGAVGTGKIQNRAVGPRKIRQNAIRPFQLAPGAVTMPALNQTVRDRINERGKMNFFQFNDGVTHCYTLGDTPSFNCYDWDYASSNENNESNGWSHYVLETEGDTTTLTLHGMRNFLSCFEWRVDGELNTLPGDNPNAAIEDGRWNFACVHATDNPEHAVTFQGISLLEVRLPFGAESDERFNWEPNVIN